jgi:hypothetical protein
MKRIFQITVLLALLFSCKKPENRTCWKFAGETKTISIPVGDFTALFLKGHLSYSLVQDSTDKLVITGGENLIGHVNWTNDNGLLTLENGNKCNFLRNPKNLIHVEIHCTNVANIRFEGTEPLVGLGTLKSDYFVLFIRDGAGPVTLDLESLVVNADIAHGWGEYHLSGTTKTARIAVRSNGFCSVDQLQITDSVYVGSESQGDITLNANGIPMAGYIKAGGNIRYKGTPSAISVIKTGGGNLIPIQ